MRAAEFLRKLADAIAVIEDDPEKTAEPVKIPISKETKDFLERHCNIERNVVGEDTYLLNNLRFKIVEE